MIKFHNVIIIWQKILSKVLLRTIRFIIYFCLLLSFQVSLLAQAKKGGIAGYILDEKTQEPLGDANVIVVNTRFGAVANKNGYFVISNLSDNTYDIQISFIGYAKYLKRITVNNNRYEIITVFLKQEAIAFDEIEVSANIDNKIETKPSTIFLPAARVKNIPAIGETDIIRSLQLLPGIQSANELSTGLYIRGGSPDQNLILLDGVTVYNPSHFFGFFSIFNNDAIKDIKLIKGGFPAEYGGRLSAILDITNKKGNNEKFSTLASVSMISSKILIEGPIKMGSYMISGRRTYFDLFIPLSGIEDIPDYYFFDYNAKLNIDSFANDKFTLSLYSGYDSFKYQEQKNDIPTKDINLGWGNRLFSASWIHLFSPKLYSNVLISASDFKSIVKSSVSGFPIYFDSRIADFSIKTYFQWFGIAGHNLKWGAWLTQYKFLSGSEIGINTGFDNTIIKRPFSSAIYLQDEWRPNSKWQLSTGLRLNYFSSGFRFNPEPRIQLRRQITENFALISAFGIYTQYITVVVNDNASFADLWYPVDETIDALKSQHYILAADYSINQNYNLQIEFYHKPMQNIVEFKPRQDTNREKLNEIFCIGSGLARGFELLLQKPSGKMNGWLGYTWSKIDRKFDQLNQGIPFSAKWDFTHDLSANLLFKINKKWTFGSTFIYRTGQTFTLPTGQYRLGPPNFSVEYIRAGIKNSSRLDPYHRLDLSVGRNFQKFGGEWKVKLNIYNVYNHRNVWFRNYQFTDSRTPPEISDVRLLPILPTFEVSFKF